MLDQCLSTVPQHQWISKLFGFDFIVEYRPGRMNIVVDALSRRGQQETNLHVISEPTFQFFHDIEREIQDNEELHQLRDNIAATRGAPWHTTQGLILKGARVFVPPNSPSLSNRTSN